MEVGSVDESSGAKIARLEATVAKIVSGEHLLGDSDLPAPVDTSKERQERAKTAERQLPERRELLLRIDEAVEQLAEFCQAERSLRADIRAAGLPKEFREPMSDGVVLTAILAKLASLGVGADRRLDRSTARSQLADLASIHNKIVNAIRG